MSFFEGLVPRWLQFEMNIHQFGAGRWFGGPENFDLLSCFSLEHTRTIFIAVVSGRFGREKHHGNTEKDGKEGAKPQLTCFGWMIFAWGVWKFKCVRISSWCQNSECSNWIQLDFRFDKPGFSVGCCCWTVIRSQQGLRLFICRVFLCQVSFPINRGTKKRFCVMHDKLLRSCKVLTWMMSRSYGTLGVKSNQGSQIPCSVYGGWLKLMVSVGKYSIYGVYGHYFLLVSSFSTNGPDFFPTRLTTVALFPGGICFLCW